MKAVGVNITYVEDMRMEGIACGHEVEGSGPCEAWSDWGRGHHR